MRTGHGWQTKREMSPGKNLNVSHAASRADGTQSDDHVRVSSLISRICNKHEATTFWRGCHMKIRMAPCMGAVIAINVIRKTP